ncbi:MAG: hypothetical protein AVDCRST_MAG48-1493 [uncultured Friedmanniella sp.]|uniref:Uncharacterized protein n=1 Tax=uncultured Friedmanniella sp. TaxID=335381 RepID=A0A6J4KE42_9ACTN|nr:MAG: hypothetical protein AVDCRST_MAG48-1493 [uncultured Friedmanniella sp.]
MSRPTTGARVVREGRTRTAPSSLSSIHHTRWSPPPRPAGRPGVGQRRQRTGPQGASGRAEPGEVGRPAGTAPAGAPGAAGTRAGLTARA